MIALVIPSNRQKELTEFIRHWQREPEWERFTVIVVSDGPEPLAVPADHNYCWSDIPRDVFSRRDSAIRSFGFAKAFQLGAETIMTLDDDCLPDLRTVSFIEEHLRNLDGLEIDAWTESIPCMRTRGLPYRNLKKRTQCVISQGLWSNVPDLDGISALAGGDGEGFRPENGVRVIPRGQLFPMCGMNLAFVRKACPLMYFPLMGEGQPYSRFDDIWCGIIAKLVCDRLDWSVAVGDAVVRHNRASDPFMNLVKEVPGVKENEQCWEMLRSIPLHSDTAEDCMEDIARGLRNRQSDQYWYDNGVAISKWLEMFA